MPRETQTRQTGDPDIQKTPMQVMAIALAVSILASGPDAFAAGASSLGVPAARAGVVADCSRPDSNAAREAEREPEQILALSGLKPGNRVADYVADFGYFTYLFYSSSVPRGRWSPPHSSGLTASLRPSRSFKATPWRIRT